MLYDKISDSKELPATQAALIDEQIRWIALFFAYLIDAYPDGQYETITSAHLEKLSTALEKQSSHNLSAGIANWDPLHGLVGLGIYYLERHKENEETACLEKIVDHLVALNSTNKSGTFWITAGVQGYSKDNYNFGMAHGMPGVEQVSASKAVRSAIS
jgi:Lanthionine synthetase C-like protein